MQKREIKHKHRVCGITRMTPNLSLPEREIARKGFLEVSEPETSLKNKKKKSSSQLAGKKKRETNRQMGKYKQRHSRTVCIAGASSLWEGLEKRGWRVPISLIRSLNFTYRPIAVKLLFHQQKIFFTLKFKSNTI